MGCKLLATINIEMLAFYHVILIGGGSAKGLWSVVGTLGGEDGQVLTNPCSDGPKEGTSCSSCSNPDKEAH